MYTHEILSQSGHAAMRHFREVTTPSGLIAVEEIGHTIARRGFNLTGRTKSGISLPGPLDISVVNGSRFDKIEESGLPDQIQCTSLEDFVHQAVDRWNSIVKNMGEITTVDVHLTEENLVTERTTPAGLVLPAEEPEIEFVRFIASPDEIEAMERIAASIQIPRSDEQPPAQSGLYL